MDRTARRRFSIHLCAGLAAVAAPATSATSPAAPSGGTQGVRLTGDSDGAAHTQSNPPMPILGQRMGGGGDDPPAPRRHVTVGAPEITGTGIAPDAIRRVVRRNLGQLTSCYDRGLHSDPMLQGQITIHFVINPAGAVTESAIAGPNLSQASTGDCAAQSFQRWTFPAPAGGGIVTVNLPITFSPR